MDSRQNQDPAKALAATVQDASLPARARHTTADAAGRPARAGQGRPALLLVLQGNLLHQRPAGNPAGEGEVPFVSRVLRPAARQHGLPLVVLLRRLPLLVSGQPP